MREVFWAIKGDFGFYISIHRTRVAAISTHVYGRYRWTEKPDEFARILKPMQREDWKMARRAGDRAVKVHLVEVAP